MPEVGTQFLLLLLISQLQLQIRCPKIAVIIIEMNIVCESYVNSLHFGYAVPDPIPRVFYCYVAHRHSL